LIIVPERRLVPEVGNPVTMAHFYIDAFMPPLLKVAEHNDAYSVVLPTRVKFGCR
jgi:hypothetical protein